MIIHANARNGMPILGPIEATPGSVIANGTLLQGPLFGGAYWQGSPQTRVQSTGRLLRGSWGSSRETVRFQASTLDNRSDAIRRAQTAGTGTDRQHLTK